MNHLRMFAILVMLSGCFAAADPNVTVPIAIGESVDQKNDSQLHDPNGDPLKSRVKAKVEELNNALINEDFSKVVTLTHPKIVEMNGGHEKMVALIASGTKEMMSKGIAISSVKVDEPSDPVAAESDLYIVAPFLLTMKVPNGRLLTKSFVIGESHDQGKSWTFVNGNVDIKQLKLLLPKLPDQLALPTQESPVFEKE